MNINLVSSAFMSSPYLLPINTGSMFLFVIYIYMYVMYIYISAYEINIISTDHKLRCHHSISFSWFSWNFLMAHSKANLKSNGSKEPLCFSLL